MQEKMIAHVCERKNEQVSVCNKEYSLLFYLLTCVCAHVCMRVCERQNECACVSRELVQLAALLLVGGLEFLVLHPEPLLLQHDLLVEAGRGQRGHQQHASARLMNMSPLS